VFTAHHGTIVLAQKVRVLPSPHLVHRIAAMTRNMELVEDDLLVSLRQMLPHTGNVRFPHIHDTALMPSRWALVMEAQKLSRLAYLQSPATSRTQPL
jgi:hypothetical protein